VLPGIGEIALRSDCMLSEYYRRPDLTGQPVREGAGTTPVYRISGMGSLCQRA
jgi:hypothetical protein